MSRTIAVYDTSLRDGAQAEDVSFSVEDKLKVIRTLASLGVGYIEAGNPGSNPKDLEFFRVFDPAEFPGVKFAAFGSTRRRNVPAAEDANVRALLTARTPVVAIFGKSWDFHVREILKAGLDENLEMIRDTVKFFKDSGKEVVFDAEHFFDGAKADREYAFQTLEAARDGGADWLVLCETNGGAFPGEVAEFTRRVVERFKMPVGIHCHDDGGMAVANSILAVEAGATQVQGTFLGFGERCGNANLSAVIPNLQLKRGYACLPAENMPRLKSAACYIAEVSNLGLNKRLPFVGDSAFAHKGGMHVDGVMKNPSTFEHVDPESVGNARRFLMSEVSGRSAVLAKLRNILPDLAKDSPETRKVVDRVKELEHQGYQFEAADASFELMVRKLLGTFQPSFVLERFLITAGRSNGSGPSPASATIKVSVGAREEIAAAEGNGPVDALDRALRKALGIFFPVLKDVRLTDFKVRVLDPAEATAARVRVLLESSDGRGHWTTVGVSTDIIEASAVALADSIEFHLLKKGEPS